MATKLPNVVLGRPSALEALQLSGPLAAGRPRLLVAWDVMVIAAAFLLTSSVGALAPASPGLGSGQKDGLVGPLESPALVFAALALVGLAMIRGSGKGVGARLSVFLRLIAVSAVAAWIAISISSLTRSDVALDQFLVISLTVPAAWLLGRVALERRTRERVLVIGSGQVAAHLTDLSLRHPEKRLDVVGWLDDDPLESSDHDHRMMGSLDDLPTVLAGGMIDRVVVCFSRTTDKRIAAALRNIDCRRIRVDVVPRLFDLIGPSTESRLVSGVPLLSVTGGCQSRSQGAAKRVFDVVGALLLVAVTLPVMALIAVAIKIDSPGPILYRSRRLGRAGSNFSMLKFRTMVTGADALHGEQAADLLSGQLKCADDPRVTRAGHHLRRFSLDELPQLFNILTGSMSLVGPRPVLISEAKGLEGWANRRHDVRPGVTGLWQISGRSTLPWDERMQLDYTYARHWSMRFDIKILASTVVAVAARKGAF